MYLKIVKCAYKKCFLSIQKIQNVYEKKLTPKNMFEKNVNHVFEKMFNEYTKMFHVLE